MQRGLFSQSGIQSEMEQIRELLDYGRSFDEYTGSIHSMAEVLFRFLESLAEPIIPFALYKQALESSSSYHQALALSLSLSPLAGASAVVHTTNLSPIPVQATALLLARGQLQRVLLPHGLPPRGAPAQQQE